MRRVSVMGRHMARCSYLIQIMGSVKVDHLCVSSSADVVQALLSRLSPVSSQQMSLRASGRSSCHA